MATIKKLIFINKLIDQYHIPLW